MESTVAMLSGPSALAPIGYRQAAGLDNRTVKICLEAYFEQY